MDTDSAPQPKVLAASVAIVGGGPVGLMLALFLDRHGVDSVVFNTERDVRWHPKGSTHSARTMEHYRRLGISAAVRWLGLPQDHPTDVAYFTRLNGRELARLRMPSEEENAEIVSRQGRTAQTPEPIHRANQMYVEKLLLSHARTRARIRLRFGWQVRSFTAREDGTAVLAECGPGGTVERWRAPYLVGCDGAHSFVRSALGVHYRGSGSLGQAFLGGRMISSYLRIPDLCRLLPADRRAWQYHVVNADLRMLLVSLNGRDEFLLMTKAPENGAPPDDGAIIDGVQRGVGAAVPVTILGHRAWTAGAALVAERLRVGRVFLAGDAAHLFTPTGGFGMNTGIDDAANLAWKLAAAVRSWGGDELLASYESERRPVALRNTEAARELARQLGKLAVPADLESDGARGEAARREAGAFLGSLGEQYASLGVQLGARYDGSPVILRDECAPPGEDFANYRPTSVPGGRAPHAWLGGGRGAGDSLFDRLGTGFTLLRLGPHAPEAGPLQAAAAERAMPLRVVEVRDPELRDLYERDLVLVRPDQYVAWRGNRLPADVPVLLDCVTGRRAECASRVDSS